MKIKGPGGPVQPPDVTPEKPAAPKSGFADKLAAPGEPKGPTRVPPSIPTDAVARITADLRSSAITPEQAIDQLLELAIAQGPAGGLPEKARAKLRAHLEQLMAEDPTLAAKTQRLGRGP